MTYTKEQLLKNEEIREKIQSDISFNAINQTVAHCIENNADIMSVLINLITNLRGVYLLACQSKDDPKILQSDTVFLDAVNKMLAEIITINLDTTIH